jgi:hypothetical protein
MASLQEMLFTLTLNTENCLPYIQKVMGLISHPAHALMNTITLGFEPTTFDLGRWSTKANGVTFQPKLRSGCGIHFGGNLRLKLISFFPRDFSSTGW